LYFIIREYYNLKERCSEDEAIFGQQFLEKLFRQPLAYLKDIYFTESAEFLVPPLPDDEIKNFLINKATGIF